MKIPDFEDYEHRQRKKKLEKSKRRVEKRVNSPNLAQSIHLNQSQSLSSSP